MKKDFTQQEILLFTNTRFTSRDWCKKDEQAQQKKLSERELLLEACWNGLIAQTLPEICEQTYDKTIALWEISEANTFLGLQYGTNIDRDEQDLSVNPYVFMEFQPFN